MKKKRHIFLRRLARLAGFEPTACRLGGGRSILLSYRRISHVIISKHARLCKDITKVFLRFFFLLARRSTCGILKQRKGGRGMRMSFVRFVAFLMALILCLSVVATALAYNTIPYGEESQDVRDMQSKLKSKGYYKGKVDGKFGPETRRAVRKFQEAIGITVDGKPGNRTLTALYEGTSAINGTRDRERIDTSKPKNPNTLYYGCEGTKVKSLQQMLKKVGCYKGAIDGVYGDLTYEAVKKYQYQKGLHADGMAGSKTLSSLRKNTQKK